MTPSSKWNTSSECYCSNLKDVRVKEHCGLGYLVVVVLDACTQADPIGNTVRSYIGLITPAAEIYKAQRAVKIPI